MKNVIIDSGSGGINFISKMSNKKDVKFIRPFNKMVNDYKKTTVKNKILNIINSLSHKNVKSIIIACHSASSSILDILIEKNFFLNGLKIFEPILPMCLHIKEKKYKRIIILSTPITQKIGWHKRLLSSENINIKYITFPFLAERIDNKSSDIDFSIKRLEKQKDYLKTADCIVMGCTHYNIIKNRFKNELKSKYNFNGDILDSNDILLKYFNNF
tara:strand:+ start:3379 stop:4023 length:645 start_codon:yes stop_codon:yes gene_type:complete